MHIKFTPAAAIYFDSAATVSEWEPPQPLGHCLLGEMGLDFLFAANVLMDVQLPETARRR